MATNFWPCDDKVQGLNGNIQGRRVTFSVGTLPLAAGKHKKLPWAPSEQGAANRHALPTRPKILCLTIRVHSSREGLRTVPPELLHLIATQLHAKPFPAEGLRGRDPTCRLDRPGWYFGKNGSIR